MAGRRLNMGAMEAWGDVRIGVMSANDAPGQENARLRVMAPSGTQTIRVELGETVFVEGVGTVSLVSMSLQGRTAPEGRPQRAGGSIEISFEPTGGSGGR